MNAEIKTKKEQISSTEKKISELNVKIKQKEVEQDRENKKNKKEIELKNLICDYKIKRKERIILEEKINIDKNNLLSLQNIKEKLREKIDDKKQKANNLYGITEIKSIKEINNLRKKYQEQQINKIKSFSE